jgi:hypothetical protein
MKRYSNSRRQQVVDAFRAHVERFGVNPSCRELGLATGMSSVGAWKHVQAAIGEGILVETKAPRSGRPRKAVELADRVDLTVFPTDRLRGELARRGLTLDALEQPRPLLDEGRACAANHCINRVGRGMLMCREHWFRLPPSYRSDIMNAWSARQLQAYGQAVEAARNFLGGFTSVVERVE